MKKINFFVWASSFICSLFVATNLVYAKPSVAVSAAPVDVRIYVLNCGYIDIHDFSSFSNNNFYPHKPMRLADPCFLIKNPKGWMIWDLGLGDQYLDKNIDDKKDGVTFSVPVSIIPELKQLGLTPKDIKYVGISHSHFDHTGNAKLFPSATWFLQDAEYKYIQQKPAPSATAPDLLPTLQRVHTILLKGDDDVFGDGTVRIISTPGHTPGHQSLEVKLPHGTVVLSGDLYHVRQSYISKLIPVFNTSSEQTQKSMVLIDKVLKDTHGRLIIQHDPQDFTALPKPPKYLN